MCLFEDCCEPVHCKGMCNRHYKWTHSQESRKTCPTPGCGNLMGRRAKTCQDCWNVVQSGEGSPNFKTGRRLTKEGYIKLTGYKDHPNANKRGVISEHTLVMSTALGRPLVKGEQVHHKYGVKSDNRIENLELWYVSQPTGQRVEDLVSYLESIGYEIIAPKNEVPE